MTKRKFITVDRVVDIIYWDCPAKMCEQYHEINIRGELPRTIHCKCGNTHVVVQLTQVGAYKARLLIEVKE